MNYEYQVGGSLRIDAPSYVERQADHELETEQQEKESIVRAREILASAHQKATKQIRIGSVVLAISLIGASIATVLTNTALQKQRTAQIGTQLEREGVSVLRQFETNQVGSLLAAMEAGQTLNKLVNPDQPLTDYPAISPILALQTMLDSIHEKNVLRLDGGYRVAQFSPDGERLVTAADLDSPKLWDKQGRLIAKLKNRGAIMYAMRFSPDGKYLATTGYDGIVILWNPQGQQIRQFRAQEGIQEIQFSPDGQYIATAGSKTANIWTLEGRQVAELGGHEGTVHRVLFSPKSNYPEGETASYRLASVDQRGRIYIWTAQGQRLATLSAHGGAVQHCNGVQMGSN
jgi:WD40 repeat protein